jgi:single-stranded-DNA-specific exonuclease
MNDASPAPSERPAHTKGRAALAPQIPTTWSLAPYSWRAAERLARELDLPVVAATVLAGRGFSDPEEARAFLACSAPIPDPFLFEHMEEAVSVISEAVDRAGRIVIHGDYDADGITATALMVLGLRDLGLEAEWYLPSRFKEGYGLSKTAVEAIAAGGPAVLIAVDCGVNYPDEVALAKKLGLEVVVVDHHQPGPTLPDCHLIHSVSGRYPHDELCGVGLALKVMHGLHVHRHEAAREALPEALQKFLDLVAIGTIADLASLRGENRAYVREGLKLITIGSRPGLRALAAVAGCTGAVDSSAVAFRLAPRLNAAGRLTDASPPLRLLLTESESEAGEIAGRLHELNGARQDVERQILDEAMARVEALEELPPIIVLAGEGWHEGVVGIVASRLVERYQRPTILLGMRDGVAKGSGRSTAAYDLMEGLNACAQHLTVYGGHTQAVGLTLPAERAGDFRRAIEGHAGAVLSALDLMPVYRADAVMRGEDVNADTAVALASLGPFGSGNPRPRLLLVEADIRQPETTRTGSHLRCTVEVDGVRARGIGFGMGGEAASLREEGNGRLLGVQFRVDEWQGSLRPEFVLERIGEAVHGTGSPRECGQGCRRRRAPSPVAERGTEVRRPSNDEGHVDPAGAESSLRTLAASRDLRDRPGRLGALLQVLATGEPAIVLGCSVPHLPGGAWGRIENAAARVGPVQCVGRGCGPSCEDHSASAGLVIAEWDIVADLAALSKGWAHVIAIDPPYRTKHVAFLRRAVREGAYVHLYYGDEERRATARLLRYLVHPRFAMVCMYRAMGEGLGVEEVFSKTAEFAWREARVVLTEADLARSHAILTELGVERNACGGAKMEARGISAYAVAEAEYEECSRLCQIL